MAACHLPTSGRFRGATSHSPSAKRSRSCSLRATEFVRSLGGPDVTRPRFHVSCDETRPLTMANSSIARRRRNGMQTERPVDQKWRSSPETIGCASTCRTDLRARLLRRTARGYSAPMSRGRGVVIAAARTGGGQHRGAQSRFPSDSGLISRMMKRCAYRMKPSIKRSTCRDAARSGVSLSRACERAVRCGSRGLARADSATSLLALKS